jgi:peptidoglycan hydrolase-like protein with peptidoglycan-binding domain
MIQTLVVILLSSFLWFWPVIGIAGETDRPGPQPPEQGTRLTKGDIQVVQERLKEFGFDPGPIDGVLHPQTEAAIREYQERHGLPVSGALDEATRRSLQVELPTGAPGPAGGAGGR